MYDARESELGTEVIRDIERRVMLSVIDQHWREHLYEMDYLQEGINLRAMGQKDPLTEWQREGFDMFEAMMSTVDEDFVRYVFNIQVVVEDAPAPVVKNLQLSAAEDPVQGTSSIRQAVAAETSSLVTDFGGYVGTGSLSGVRPSGGDDPTDGEEETQAPVRVEKTPGRNEPCWCGSGKKYKVCHGAT